MPASPASGDCGACPRRPASSQSWRHALGWQCARPGPRKPIGKDLLSLSGESEEGAGSIWSGSDGPAGVVSSLVPGGQRALTSTDPASPQSQLCPELSLSPNSLQDGKEYLFQAKDEVSCPLPFHTPRAPLPFLEPSSRRFPFLPSSLSFSSSVSFFEIRRPTLCQLDVCEGRTETPSLS